MIQCSFRRDIILPPESLNRFNLDQMYYLFMAHGRAEDGEILLFSFFVVAFVSLASSIKRLASLSPGQTHRHDRQPLISAYQTAMTGLPEDLTGSRSPLLMKYHGEAKKITNTSWKSKSIHCAMKPIRIQLECPYNSSNETKYPCMSFYVFIFIAQTMYCISAHVSDAASTNQYQYWPKCLYFRLQKIKKE